MPRPSKRQPVESPEDHITRLNKWFASADAGVEGVADWDIKRDLFVDVLLAILADGVGVWFGMTRTGRAISITLVDGEVKQRAYVGDAIEWDDYWEQRVAAMQQVRAARTETQNRIVRTQEAAD